MGKVTAASLQEVLDKTNFLSIFQEKVRLQKKGGKWWGLCPFHTEKTASFSVDPDRGLFYCFGCQKGGSVIDFLMETERISFTEAVSELADKAGVRIQYDGPAPGRESTEKTELYSLYDKLTEAFHWILLNSPAAGEARAILKKRKMPDLLIDGFRLGYAPADRTWLYRFLRSKSFSEEFLAETGLFSSRSREFPLFADRIIFPISDMKGRVIAFGGRLISGDGPKYINSPDTEIFRKQENLFAIDKALPYMKEMNTALVCEGYMDALSFHAAGISYAVAPLGTAFTQRQAQILRRKADRVLLCFDSDDAGQKAAEKACCTAAAAGLEVFVLKMNEGKDASEILENYGPEALKKVLECSISSVDFYAHRAEILFDVGTVEGKVKASAFLFPYLDALDSEIKRNAIVETFSRELGINPASLSADYNKAQAANGGRSASASQQYRSASAVDNPSGEKTAGARTADIIFMTAVVLRPESFAKVKGLTKAEDLDDPRARDLYFALEEAAINDAKDTASILSYADDESAINFVLSKAAGGELDQGIDRIIDDGIRNVRIRSLEKARTRLISEIGHASRDDSETTSADSGQSVLEMLRQKMQLDSELAHLKGEVDE